MMKKRKKLLTWLCAYVMAFAMVSSCLMTDGSVKAYAETTLVRTTGVQAANAKKTTKIDKISVSSTYNYAYEGQKFNETSFRKNTTVKVKKNGKIYTVKAYKVSATKYVKANGIGKNKGKFVVKVTYGGRSVAKYVDVIKGIKATSNLKTLNEGEKLDAKAFKKSVTAKRVFANGKTKVIPASSFKLVNAPSTIWFNSKAHPDSVGVKIQSGNKATYAYVKINPLSKIAVTSNTVGVLNEGSTFSEKDFRKNITVRSYYKTSSANKNITGYTVSVPSKTVKPDKNGKYVVTIKYGSQSTTVPITVSSFKQINAKLNNTADPLYEGTTFDAETFKSNVTVYKTYTNSTRTTPVTNFTVSAAKTITPDTNGKFNITIKSGSKRATLAVPVKKIDTFYAKPKENYTLKADQAFDESVFRSSIDASANYGVYTRVVEDYTISVANGTIVKADENNNFVVTITFADKTATVAIPVVKAEDPTPEPTVSKITVSSNIPYLYNGTEVDNTLKATIENSLTVTATMSDGSTKTLDSSLYKVRTVTRVVVYTGESGGFRVDVDYSDDITGKCYIPVITGIVVHPKDTSASFELTKGASYTKEDFLKLFDVFDIYGDQHEEACKEYEFIAPETVYANGEGEFAGQFVVKVTSNSGNFNYSVSYKIIDGGTVNPDPTPIGGQEVDWLYYYGNFVSVSESAMITVRAAVNAPSDCGTLTEWGVMCLHSENIDITKNPENARSLLGPIQNNSGSEPFLDQINDDEWASLTIAQYRIYAIVEKDGISTTYYSKVLYVEKSTGNYYFSK